MQRHSTHIRRTKDRGSIKTRVRYNLPEAAGGGVVAWGCGIRLGTGGSWGLHYGGSGTAWVEGTRGWDVSVGVS